MKNQLTFLTLFASGVLATLADVNVSEKAPLPRFLKQFDTNGDEIIDEEERQAIADLRIRLRESNRDSIDLNQDGKIQRDEIESTREILRRKIEDRRLEKFREIAGEDDLISKEEYAKIPGSDQLPEFVFQGIFDRLDANHSGEISIDEFFHRLKPHQGSPRSKTTRTR